MERSADQTMRILLVSSEYPPETGSGGIGTYVKTLAPALADLGHQVTVLTRAANGGDRVIQERERLRVLRIADVEPPAGFWQSPFSSARASLAAEHYRRAYTVAVTLMMREDLGEFDIVEAPDWAGEGALLSLSLPDVPYVVKFHTPAQLVFGWNDPSVGPDFVDALHDLEAVGVANASAWSCPSAWMGAACEQLFGLPADSVRALPNPFDPERLGVLEDKPSDAPQPEILYLGRLETRKGVLDVVPALSRVLHAVPEATFRLIGSDTCSAPGGQSVQETLLSLFPEPMRPRVVFDGHVAREDIAEALRRASAVLLPSRQENFPYTCLEAMAAGAAVVASRHGGMAEMIETNRSGVLVDPENSDQVSETLLRLLLQPEVARRLGQAARERVLAYAPRAMAEQHVAFYREITQSAGHEASLATHTSS